jgi:predicted flap endonuclease-1-like 5' DNA nuclease
VQPTATTPTLPPEPAVVEPIKKEITEPVVEVAPTAKLDLTAVKGIKAKRAEQLKSVGIGSIEDLARASADDVGNKLKISPKITGKWIEQAKLLLEKS